MHDHTIFLLTHSDMWLWAHILSQFLLEVVKALVWLPSQKQRRCKETTMPFIWFRRRNTPPKKLEFLQEPHVGEGKAEADTSRAGRLVSLEEICNLTDHLGTQTRWWMEPHFDHIA